MTGRFFMMLAGRLDARLHDGGEKRGGKWLRETGRYGVSAVDALRRYFSVDAWPDMLRFCARWRKNAIKAAMNGGSTLPRFFSYLATLLPFSCPIAI